MQKNMIWKWLILIALIAASMAVVYPPRDRKDAQGNTVRAGKIKLGLDLQGGTSFVVAVDPTDLKKKIEESSETLTPERVAAKLKTDVRNARDVGLEAIRNRVDNLGIAEPQIFPELDDRIVVQMPGIDAAKREEARRSIQSVAFLEFRLVHRDSDKWVKRLLDDEKTPRGFRLAGEGSYVRDRSLADDKMDPAYWAELRRFAPHEGAEFMMARDEAPDGSTIYKPYYVETTAQMTGKGVSRAMVDYDQMNRPKISLEFNKEGRRRFARVTRDYAPRGDKNRDSEEGRQLAIILDGTLYSAPSLREEISSGRAEITGKFTMQECKRLVNVLKTGSLLAPMRIVEERTVDPTLGQDSVDSGVRATLVGTALVVIFMLFYYMIPGIIANIAVLLDLLLLPLSAVIVAGFMGIITGGGGGGTMELPTLTLPGIAGIALTFGHAVDANVLIYERMREEFRAGKNLTAAIQAGYEKAFLTIFDANITTLLAGVIMFWQGSGPVRGYAITLCAGIVASLYTAVWVTRMIFDWLASKPMFQKPGQQLKMHHLIPDTKIDFIGNRHYAYAFTIILILVSIVSFSMKGQKNFGVDFIGGSSLTVEFKQKPAVEQIRSVLGQAGVREVNPQYQKVSGNIGGGDKEVLVINVPFEDGDKAADALLTKFTGAGFKVLSRDQVGPQIGNELKKKGVMAVVWSLIGIIIYISWRFEFSYGVGAIVALIHDAIVAVGLFCLMGRQLNAGSIAVVLTIIGYSVMDTVVVFDRIREGVKLHRGMKFIDICNLAINQTLSRTLITSGTVLLTTLGLLVFGGGAINDFALLLFIGVVIGTYSSIFIATPIMMLWHRETLQEKTGDKVAAKAEARAGRNGAAKAPAKA